MCETCWKLTTKAAEDGQWLRSLYSVLTLNMSNNLFNVSVIDFGHVNADYISSRCIKQVWTKW